MSDTGFYLLPTNKLFKKEDTKRLKNFPAGCVENFYRNLADKVDNVQSNFLSAISGDKNIPKDDIQKYLLATSDFAKSMQTDINHYVTKDRINDASFRQKLDPISKNIIRRQNPLELVFKDISTFDSENPIVGSLLREIDIRKKQTDSDWLVSQERNSRLKKDSIRLEEQQQQQATILTTTTTTTMLIRVVVE